MNDIAYRPPQNASRDFDIVQVSKKNFPFSHVFASTAAGGVQREQFKLQNNIIITGIFFSLNTDSSAASASMNVSLNGVQVAAQTVVSAVGAPQSISCYVDLPNWNTSADSVLETVTNTTAGHGQANITWIGYYE